MSVLDQKMEARRQQILEAARGLIETDGYDALTMRNLANESGVTVPTIYNLIGNKEQVLFEAIEDQTVAFASKFEVGNTDLISVVEATVRHLIRRPRYYRAVLLVLARSDRADSARRHVGRAVALPIANSIDALAQTGTLASWVDREMLAQRIHTQLDMACLEWARGSLTATSFRAAALVDLAMTMLGLTSAGTRKTFEGIIRESQGDALHRGRRTNQRRHAA
jgi:AcrR family transcriptional regulator